MRTYKFIREANRWYIDLPAYIEQGGDKAELEMVAGADTMLDIMSEGASSVTLTIDRTPFEGADLVRLIERCDPSIGGGNYFMQRYKGRNVDMRMWLCSVTEFVFGDIPPEIYVRKES
ncbi:MAG TPA: DUF6717 family protein [Chitinophagaceae bacterium]|nr:DUF6717 family protein [Chitinophagaceae bacterium]